MGALLQLIGEPPDDQIATEAQGRSGVMQRPPHTPQLLCRPIDQPGNVAIKPDRVRVSPPVLPATVWTGPENRSPGGRPGEGPSAGGLLSSPGPRSGRP